MHENVKKGNKMEDIENEGMKEKKLSLFLREKRQQGRINAPYPLFSSPWKC